MWCVGAGGSGVFPALAGGFSVRAVHAVPAERCAAVGEPRVFSSASLPCPYRNPKRCAEEVALRPAPERQPLREAPLALFVSAGETFREKGAANARPLVSAPCREPRVRGPCGRAAGSGIAAFSLFTPPPNPGQVPVRAEPASASLFSLPFRTRRRREALASPLALQHASDPVASNELGSQ